MRGLRKEWKKGKWGEDKGGCENKGKGMRVPPHGWEREGGEGKRGRGKLGRRGTEE